MSETRRTRFADWLGRYRGWLLAAWIVHAVVLHALLLGMPSWDGFAYRLPPIVELVQHGGLGLDKYWVFPFQGFIPFAELTQAPLLAVLGLPALLLTGPLIVFPLCVLAIYKLGTKLTASTQGGTFAALAYVAIPLVNDQPFSGYIDYIVSAAVAYFVFALLELDGAARPWRAAVRIVIAVAIVSLTKPTGLYVCAMLSGLVLVGRFVARDQGRLRIVGKRTLGIALAAIAIGALPALTIQVIKLVHYGGPLYPYQFNVLGLKLGPGLPAKEMFAQSGLADETWREFGANFVAGWVWPRGAPSAFYDSRSLGGGWVLVVALAVLPVFLRSATRFEKWLGVSCVIVSVLARDFWYPRWSYTLIVALCMVIGRALPELARADRHRWRFWLAVGGLLLHLARPEYELWLVRQPGLGGPRLDVLGSPWFQGGAAALAPMPDLHARFVILEYTRDGFLVPLYGQRLTNEVVATIPRAHVGPRCEGLRQHVARDPQLRFIDDLDTTRGCARTCALPDKWGPCRVWQLFPSPAR